MKTIKLKMLVSLILTAFMLALNFITLYSQCSFTIEHSSNPPISGTGFSYIAGCQEFTICITGGPTPEDNGDVIVGLGCNQELDEINLGDYDKEDFFNQGRYIGSNLTTHFIYDINEPPETKCFTLLDMFGITEIMVDVFAKCEDESLYTKVYSYRIGTNNGYVLTGSLQAAMNLGKIQTAVNSCDNSISQFTVDGNLDIDPDAGYYCMKGQGGYQNGYAHIRMLPGSTITVKSGKTLNLINNYIIACDGERWNSIIVEPGATLNVTNTTFDNGHYEITALAGSTVMCKGSSFKDGAVGINAENGAIVNADNCDFTFSGAFNAYYSGEPSIVGNRTFAGIKGFNTPIKISNGSTFTNLLNGVWGFNSNIDDNGSNYTDIWDYGTNNYGTGSGAVFNGNGIHTISTSGNNLNVESSNFNGGNTGIYSKGVNCSNIKLNTMPYILTGMYFDQSPGRDFDIKHNTINATSRGIVFGWTGEVKSITVDDANSISLIDANSIGIDLLEVYGPNKYIHNNNISIGSGYVGINHTNSRNSWIYNNSIYSNGSGTQKTFGVSIFGKDNVLTACNLLSSSMNCQNNGLYVSESANNVDLGNYATGWYYDYQFLGTSLGTAFASNRMGDANHGLILGFQTPGSNISARIGVQEHLGNRWTGTHTKGAYHYGFSQDRIYSKFTVNAQDPNNTNLKPSNFTELVGIQWFEHNNNSLALNFSCMGIGSGNPHPFPRVFPRTDDYFILNNDFDTAYDWGSRVWTDRRQLYRELLYQYDNGNDSIPVSFDTFFNQYSNTTVGQFEIIDYDLSNLYLSQSETQSQINIKIDSIVAIENEVNELLILIRDSVANLNVDSTLQVIEDLNIQKYAINISKDSLAEDLNSNVASGLDQILTDNNSIETTELYEQYQQIVNTVMLEKMIDGLWSFDETEKTLIDSIANQCPYFSGEGVYRARALAANYSLNRYDDEEACNTAEPFGHLESRLSEEKNKIVLYPNPVNNELTILNNNQNIIKVFIRNMEGKLIKSKEVKEGTNQISINTEELLSGIYLSEITLLDGSIVFRKFIKK
ncbi:MAG: T9SS type A sorting domain-containing protein [Saprospiraceae bacterium]